MGTRPINRTERLSTIEKMLFRSPNGLRAVEIAQVCGVDRRTVYRDLALLDDIGVPIHQQDGRFFLNHEQYFAAVRLSSSEALSLYLAVRLQSLHTSIQNPYLASALRKLTNALPEPGASHVTLMTETTNARSVDRGLVAVMDTIVQAWSEKRKVKIWHTSPSERKATERNFATYFIEPSPQGELYIVGFDERSRRVRAFPMAYIKRAKLLRMTYELPFRFDPRPYFAQAWGISDTHHDEPTEVVLLFDTEVTPQLLSRVGQQSPYVQLLDSGRCLLRVIIAHWQVMLPWIRSWGAHVEVIEPSALRQMIAEEAEKILNRHRGTPNMLAQETGRSG